MEFDAIRVIREQASIALGEKGLPIAAFHASLCYPEPPQE